MDAGRQTTVKRQIDEGREVMTKAQFALQCKQYIFQYVVTPKIFFFCNLHSCYICHNNSQKLQIIIFKDNNPKTNTL